MRDRVFELLPFVLVAVILLALQMTRADGPPPARTDVSAAMPESTPPTGLAAAAVRRPTRVTGVTAATPACNSDQPRFIGRVALLRAALGSTMGDPVNCEREADEEGNTQQKTTTGLAYYRKVRNVAVFTTGWEHWALLPESGLVYWASNEVEPPPNAYPVTR
jgi:hypothetical protein